jgi:hypothetical protein
MAYDPDQSNNVFTRDCQGEGLDQHFDYVPLTQEIKQDGLCLDIISANALMMPCSGTSSQKWSYDITSNQIKSTNYCLETEVSGNIKGATCGTTQNQQFIFPESWTMPVQQAALDASTPYHSNSIPPAIWSSNQSCLVDWLNDTMKTCDDSMALLLGSSTSLGTLRAVAKLVNEKGPERMPGTCCLDTSLTSQFFGYHVSYGVKVCYHTFLIYSYLIASTPTFTQYDPATMECQNPGPWHLGITAEACENARGR